MALFKPAAPDSGNVSKSTARLEALVWVLIYAGLLIFVMGLAVAGYDTTLAWSLMGSGGALAALGVVLIYVRSRIQD